MHIESETIQRTAAEFIRDRYQLGAFVNGLLRDAHAAEDVLQEVWVRLAAEVEKGTRLENQAAWCRGVARNLVRRLWERQQSAKVVMDSAMVEEFLDRVEEAFAEEGDAAEIGAARLQALLACVSTLPEKSRALVSMKYEARASMDEIALVLEQTFEAVTKTLYRIRRALLECVERKLAQF